MALSCFDLCRLNYISQNSLTCMFPVRMDHKADPCQFWKKATILAADLLRYLRGVKQQLCLQLLYFPWISFQFF